MPGCSQSRHARSRSGAAGFRYVHRELGRLSVTLLLLWNEYVAGCRESGACRIGTRISTSSTAGGCRQRGRRCIPRTPGEQSVVDWAGDPMSYADPLTGTAVRAWLFVAALPYSAYTFVEAFTDMTLGSWIEAMCTPSNSSAAPAAAHPR